LLGTDAGFFIADADPATKTDPLDADTDGDGFADGTEDLDHDGMVDPGETDPSDPSSFPAPPIPALPLGARVALAMALLAVGASRLARHRSRAQIEATP
jgi:hypothetical protein